MNKLTNLALVAGLGALSLTACGGSDDGGGSAEAVLGGVTPVRPPRAVARGGGTGRWLRSGRGR